MQSLSDMADTADMTEMADTTDTLKSCQNQTLVSDCPHCVCSECSNGQCGATHSMALTLGRTEVQGKECLICFALE